MYLEKFILFCESVDYKMTFHQSCTCFGHSFNLDVHVLYFAELGS